MNQRHKATRDKCEEMTTAERGNVKEWWGARTLKDFYKFFVAENR